MGLTGRRRGRRASGRGHGRFGFRIRMYPTDMHGRRERGPLAETKQFSGRRRHNVSLRNRESLSLEGVTNVDSFDDEQVVVETDSGVLIVRGEQLHIKELNLEGGTLQLTGLVHALEYAGDSLAQKGRGLLGKLFR